MPRGVASAPVCAGDRLVEIDLDLELELEPERSVRAEHCRYFICCDPLDLYIKADDAQVSSRSSPLFRGRKRVWWPFPERRSESGAAHRASLGARVRAVRIGAEKRSHGTLGRTAARCQTPEATAVHKSSSVKLSAASSSSVSTRLTKSSALVA